MVPSVRIRYCANRRAATASVNSGLKRLGFERIVTLEQFTPLRMDGGEIMSVPFTGEHGDLDVQSKHCVIVRLAGEQVLFMVDSDAVDPAMLRRIAVRIGPVDVTFLGMECCGAPVSWIYGPLFSLRAPVHDGRDSGVMADTIPAA
jgi:hypothetical protein